MRAIIHFSAFEQTGEDEFIVKELAIVNPDVNTVQSWMFKAPFDISQLPLTLQFDNEYLAMHIFGVTGPMVMSHTRIFSAYLPTIQSIFLYSTPMDTGDNNSCNVCWDEVL